MCSALKKKKNRKRKPFIFQPFLQLDVVFWWRFNNQLSEGKKSELCRFCSFLGVILSTKVTWRTPLILSLAVNSVFEPLSRNIFYIISRVNFTVFIGKHHSQAHRIPNLSLMTSRIYLLVYGHSWLESDRQKILDSVPLNPTKNYWNEKQYILSPCKENIIVYIP